MTWGEGFRAVYVQPAWLSGDQAYLVAMTGGAPPAAPHGAKSQEDEMWREQLEKAEQQVAQLEQILQKRDREIKELEDSAEALRSQVSQLTTLMKTDQREQVNHTDTDKTIIANAGKIPMSDPGLITRQAFAQALGMSPEQLADYWWNETWPLIRDKMLADPMTLRVIASYPRNRSQNDAQIRATGWRHATRPAGADDF